MILFADVSSLDYHLTDGSAAVGADLDLGTEMKTDIYDEARGDDGLYDIGADEFIE